MRDTTAAEIAYHHAQIARLIKEEIAYSDAVAKQNCKDRRGEAPWMAQIRRARIEKYAHEPNYRHMMAQTFGRSREEDNV